MLTGEPFDAEYARQVGLVTHVTDDVTAVVDHLCAAMPAAAPQAVAATKRLLGERRRRGHRATRRSPGCARSPTSHFQSAEAAEGMAAFAARRAPSWQEPGAS